MNLEIKMKHIEILYLTTYVVLLILYFYVLLLLDC
jgi:hypothetical protein